MALVKKVVYDGEEQNFVEVPFEIVREDWSEYSFADGGRVRVKTVVTRLSQMVDDDGQPMLDPSGERIILVERNIQAVASG